jgi:predicted acetylornithine/succinylornithine family transaminase
VPEPIPPCPHLVQNYARTDVRFVRGEGCWLIDDRGRRYLDAFGGIAVNLLGHGHPGLVAAIAKQAATLIHTSNLYHNPQQEALAARLCGQCFGPRAFFCNSGTEANECAYKVVRLWGNQVHGGRKTRLIAAEHSFHGRTIGALSLTANPAYRTPFAPLPPVEFVPYGDAAALAKAVGDDVAGVFLEPLQGEGGVHVAPAGYLARARELCDRHQALLVFDEVQCGMGRTGKLFCHQYDGVFPDVMTLAKGIAGGVPMGAAVMTEACAALLKPGTHASTFGGNHLACAAALAVLDQLLAPGFLDGVTARGAQLADGLRRLFGSEVRGRGLLLGVQFDADPKPLVAAALECGLVVGTAGGNTLRLAPPLIITAAQVDEIIAKLAEARKRL